MDEGWEQWDAQVAAFHARFAPFFFRAEVRERSRRYLQALLGPVERNAMRGVGVSLYFRDPDGSLLEFISYELSPGSDI